MDHKIPAQDILEKMSIMMTKKKLLNKNLFYNRLVKVTDAY